MEAEIWIELFGYLGSTLVVVSMLMASVVKLRNINTIGSVISATYALIIGSLPLALMNISLIVINLYNLFKLLKTEQEYDLIFLDGTDGFGQYFLNRYRADIRSYFPGFEPREDDDAYMVCCNGDPAGILMGKEVDGCFMACLDYTTPTYRDCSVGRYLYQNLAAKGIRAICMDADAVASHAAYMEKMGFSLEQGAYVKYL